MSEANLCIGCKKRSATHYSEYTKGVMCGDLDCEYWLDKLPKKKLK